MYDIKIRIHITFAIRANFFFSVRRRLDVIRKVVDLRLLLRERILNFYKFDAVSVGRIGEMSTVTELWYVINSLAY